MSVVKLDENQYRLTNSYEVKNVINFFKCILELFKKLKISMMNTKGAKQRFNQRGTWVFDKMCNQNLKGLIKLSVCTCCHGLVCKRNFFCTLSFSLSLSTHLIQSMVPPCFGPHPKLMSVVQPTLTMTPLSLSISALISFCMFVFIPI